MVRQGFLLIDLMVALFLFIAFVCAVMRLQVAIVRMNNEIMARTELIEAFCAAIEGSPDKIHQGFTVDVTPLAKLSDTILPLHSITITKKRADVHCSLEMVGWVYEK